MARACDAWRRLETSLASSPALFRAGDARVRALWNATVATRLELMGHFKAMSTHAVATATDAGGLGVLAGLNQASFPRLVQSLDLATAVLRDGLYCAPSSAPRCYVDGGPDLAPGRPARILPFYGQVGECSDQVAPSTCARVSHMSLEYCAAACRAMNASHTVAGVEGKTGSQCRCGVAIPEDAQEAPAEDCASPCAGNTDEHCGGDWRIQAFEFTCSRAHDPLPDLPSDATFAAHERERYEGPPRLFALSPPSHATSKTLDVVAIADYDAVDLAFRAMGAGEWTTVPMAARGRGAYVAATVPFDGALEFFLAARGRAATWPAGGANNAHTVIPI